jgi:Tol biopolymer transport system component
MSARRLKLLLSTLVLSSTVASPLGGVDAQVSSDRVVFAAMRDGDFDLFSVGPDGSDLQALMNTAHQEWDPALAENGRIAFSRLLVAHEASDIWVSKVDGSLRNLTREYGGPHDRDPAWSRDATRIAWSRNEGGPNSAQIWVMGAGGADKTRLTSRAPNVYDHSPAWSADEARIAFVSNRGGGFPDIWIMNSNGGNPRRLLRTGAIEGNPAWSPDGTQIAYECRPPTGTTSICVVNANGSGNPQKVTTGVPGNEAQPAWSPDGTHLVYTSYPARGGNKDLFTISLETGATRRLTTNAMIDYDAAWGVVGPISGRSSIAEETLSGTAAADLQSTERTSRMRTLSSGRIAPGVRYVRGRYEHSDIYVLKMRRGRRPTLDVALANNRLPGRERLSSMARRHDAIAAINGDFPLLDGSPSGPFAEDGDLKASSFGRSHNFAMAADESRMYMDHPIEMIQARERSSGDVWAFERWNRYPPTPAEVGGFSRPGGNAQPPPRFACSARLLPKGGRRWTEGKAAIIRLFDVDLSSCRSDRMGLHGGVVLSAQPSTDGALLIDSLERGERVSLDWSIFGWRAVADSMGGYPVLLHDGRTVLESCQASFCQRHPRSGIGATGGGQVLLVVADGRRSRSWGLTLYQFARLFRSLGAEDAINFDGGGSATMWVKGRIRNRPAAGFERAVCCAVMILPGRDRKERIGSPTTSGPNSDVTSLGPVLLPTRSQGIEHLLDPASTGGMLDAMARGLFGADPELPPQLRAALRIYRRGP